MTGNSSPLPRFTRGQMQRLAVVLAMGAIIAAVAGSGVLARPQPVKLPFPAPEIKASTWLNTDDTPLLLRQQRGQVVLLEFWRFGCAMCQEAVPMVESWRQKFGPRGLVILTVHSARPQSVDENDLSKLRKFISLMHVRVPVAVDNSQKTMKAFGIAGHPTFMLVDRNGNVVYSVTGPYRRRLERAIEALLRGEELPAEEARR